MIVSLNEEVVFDELTPLGMKGWRYYRIEYVDETIGYSRVEGSIWLPPGVGPEWIEAMFDRHMKGEA